MNQPNFDLQELKASAATACANAHAPYSRFYVGSAVLDRNGRLFVGCNVENASYGMTLCAERNAISSAVTAGMGVGDLATVVIYTPGENPASPCGACRQVMQEFMRSQARIYSCCDSERVMEWTVEELLPAPFTLQQGKNQN